MSTEQRSNGMHHLIIRGHRVLLRPPRDSDLEESLRVWTPELRHMYGGSLTSERRPTMEDRRRWLERAKLAPAAHLSIEADGHYIGHLGLTTADESNKRGRFVIGIEDPQYWGKGYGTEVTRLMLRYAFETLELHRVELRVAAYNTRAIRCYEKAGFRHEGVERDSFFVDGRWHDDVLMAILRQDWEELPGVSQCAGMPGRVIPSVHPERSRGEARNLGLVEREPRAFVVRVFTINDYDQVAKLWRAAGLGPRPSDTRDEVAKKLWRDPDLFLVACLGARIVGSVIGAWDGRRGFVYRMAVHPEYHRRGIGSALIRELEKQLRDKGALSINIILNADNAAAHAFYRSLGYADREEVRVMGKGL
jgi:ribosomal-protein-alanine N-acetyltransferase